MAIMKPATATPSSPKLVSAELGSGGSPPPRAARNGAKPRNTAPRMKSEATHNQSAKALGFANVPAPVPQEIRHKPRMGWVGWRRYQASPATNKTTVVPSHPARRRPKAG